MNYELDMSHKSVGYRQAPPFSQVGDGELIYVRGCSGEGAASILLRGANEFMLDEMDRAVHDALMVRNLTRV
jgi:T-complex protein 1 subunit alpha